MCGVWPTPTLRPLRQVNRSSRNADVSSEASSDELKKTTGVALGCCYPENIVIGYLADMRARWINDLKWPRLNHTMTVRDPSADWTTPINYRHFIGDKFFTIDPILQRRESPPHTLMNRSEPHLFIQAGSNNTTVTAGASKMHVAELRPKRRRPRRSPAFGLSLPTSGGLRHLLSKLRCAFGSGRRQPPRTPRAPPRPARLAVLAAGSTVPAASATGTGPTRVLLLISDTGGGHRASADALAAAFAALYPGRVETRVVDFWTEIAGRPFDKFPEGYSFLAKNPPLWRAAWNYGKFPLTRRITEEVANAVANRNFAAALRAYRPHLIVSVHPLTQFIPLRVIRALPEPSRPAFVTVCTDLAGAHPTWFDPGVDLCFVASSVVRRLALRLGLAHNQLRQYGLPVRPAFWTEAREKSDVRAALGLAQEPAVVLIVGGGDGVGGVGRIASAVATRVHEQLGSDAAQIVVVCGKNKSLARDLRSRVWPVPVRVEGFVTNMSEWMAASDMIVSKAGPGTIAEALIRGLPIVLSGFLPGQEEPNVKYVTSAGVGEFSREPPVIAKIVADWLAHPEDLRRRAARAKALGRPQAAYDIVREIGNLVALDADPTVGVPVL